MSYQHIYTPAALIEYKNAVNWYGVQSTKAAENFVIAIKERIKIICENPLRYKKGYKYFRETLLKKYPYYIVYFIDDDKQTVIISS